MGQSKSTLLVANTIGAITQNAVKAGPGKLLGVFCQSNLGTGALIQIIDGLTTAGTVVAAFYTNTIGSTNSALAVSDIGLNFYTGMSVVATGLVPAASGTPPGNLNQLYLTLIFE